MNYLKKKIKTPISLNNNNESGANKDLEDDLYDEYVVEAPPHPSELIALGVNPDEIDINDPDKLRELFKKAKEEGKDKKVNSVLLAKQRQKEEIEEKKKTKEEWKFFDSITARVEQAVKDSQKTLDQLKETSTVDKLTEPEYELRLTADQLFKTTNTVKQEKSADSWIDFGEGRGLGKMSQEEEENKNNIVVSDTNSKQVTQSEQLAHVERGSSENNRRSSDVAKNPFGADKNANKRLYHRNMSSFEAASLHLEQQQQLQQNSTLMNDLIDGSGADQTDLIAKMTADFQSAIETNDKEYATGTNPFENFDPFETIVDDDISFPSPTVLDDNNNNNKSAITTNNDNDKTTNIDQRLTDSNFFNPFETVADDEVGIEKPQSQAYEDLNRTLNSTTIHQAPAKESSDDSNSTMHNIKPEPLTEGSTSIESVIENVKTTSAPINSTTPSTSQVSPTLTDTKKTNENKENEIKSSARFRGPPETAALPRPKPMARAEGQQVASPLMMTPLRTPARKIGQNTAQKKKKKKKSNGAQQADDDDDDDEDDNNKEDSSDSSDEDDRIRILIKAREPEKFGDDKDEANNTQVPLPFLPPPPSRNLLMQQVRERGKLDEISYDDSISDKKSAAKVDSFENFLDEKTTVDETNSSLADNKSKSKRSNRDEDDDDDEDDDFEEDRIHKEDEENEPPRSEFVIPMVLSDEDDDGYEKPETPLFDEDTSYVLEEFPGKYEGSGWEMMLRYPPKKKLTTNRFWKKIFVRLAQVQDTATSSQNQGSSKASSNKNSSSTNQQNNNNNNGSMGDGTCVVLQIFDKPEDKKPMQEIPIQATYTVSEINSQQFDQFGKIFTIRLDYIFYKERFGVRQGQLARFIHTGHIGSSTTSGGHGVDPISIGAIKRMGAPIEHSPQSSQIIKLGCSSYHDMKEFKNCLEDYLFKMPINRDRALSTYKTEEVQMAVRDETYIELNQIGQIMKQLARVRLFFLSFLNGMPIIEVGINDIQRQGKEVVGRMDILPVVTEEWIRLESCELHSTVDVKEFENEEQKMIKLTPPDATFFELMRFRVRPPRNRELPLQITANMSVTRTKVTINCDVMVPGCVSRKHGQIPCENIAIRIQIPDCWIYFFREEKHFRMGSKKSVNRRAGKVKGIERFLGGGGLQDINDESSLIEVTSGQAKYEHHHNAIVWRAPRWPKDNQSAYVQNTMKIRLPLTAYDKMPTTFYEYVHVEYTMPATTVSHTTLRSISVNPCDEEPPEKYVKYSAKYEYKVKMRMSINTKPGGGAAAATIQEAGEKIPESSPIVIMKQPDLQGDLQKEEDINSDTDSDLEEDKK